jgi:hypothetical protein
MVADAFSSAIAKIRNNCLQKPEILFAKIRNSEGCFNGIFCRTNLSTDFGQSDITTHLNIKCARLQFKSTHIRIFGIVEIDKCILLDIDWLQRNTWKFKKRSLTSN